MTYSTLRNSPLCSTVIKVVRISASVMQVVIVAAAVGAVVGTCVTVLLTHHVLSGVGNYIRESPAGSVAAALIAAVGPSPGLAKTPQDGPAPDAAPAPAPSTAVVVRPRPYYVPRVTAHTCRESDSEWSSEEEEPMPSSDDDSPSTVSPSPVPVPAPAPASVDVAVVVAAEAAIVPEVAADAAAESASNTDADVESDCESEAGSVVDHGSDSDEGISERATMEQQKLLDSFSKHSLFGPTSSESAKAKEVLKLKANALNVGNFFEGRTTGTRFSEEAPRVREICGCVLAKEEWTAESVCTCPTAHEIMALAREEARQATICEAMLGQEGEEDSGDESPSPKSGLASRTPLRAWGRALNPNHNRAALGLGHSRGVPMSRGEGSRPQPRRTMTTRIEKATFASSLPSPPSRRVSPSSLGSPSLVGLGEEPKSEE